MRISMRGLHLCVLVMNDHRFFAKRDGSIISTKSIGVPHISTKNVGVLGSLGIAPWSISTGNPSGSRVVDLSSGWE
jgi:hypothetical protein